MIVRIIDNAIIFIVLISILLLGKSITIALGGTLSFIILLGILHYGSYRFRKLKPELTILNLIIFLVCCINYFNFLDSSNAYQKLYLAIGLSITILMICFCLGIIFMRSLRSLNEEIAREVITLIENYKFIVVRSLSLAFFYPSIVSICLFDSCKNANLIETHILKMVPISFAWVLIFLICMRINLKEIDIALLGVIFKKISIRFSESMNFKQLYFIIMGAILILGSIIELLRKEWILWFESYLIVNVVFLLQWEIVKQRSDTKQNDDLIIIRDIKPMATFKGFLKFIVLHSLVITLFMIALLLTIIGREGGCP
ncbi:MAG: hypothetical protein ACOX2W_09910 [Desulfomonilia bacterium]|jgi:hypothetical protein|nr:hypothetical protein [Desulfomonilia bacterium]